MNTCHLCNKSEKEVQHLMPEGYYDDIYLCHDCWFSEEGKEWRLSRERDDPAYKNYIENITAGFPITCKSCDHKVLRVPKFIGHSPQWELNCDSCSKVNYRSPSPYEYDFTKWLEISDLYMKGKFEVSQNIELLDSMANKLNLPHIKCECGGTCKILAKPRCLNCNSVISESLFHNFDEFYA